MILFSMLDNIEVAQYVHSTYLRSEACGTCAWSILKDCMRNYEISSEVSAC